MFLHRPRSLFSSSSSFKRKKKNRQIEIIPPLPDDKVDDDEKSKLSKLHYHPTPVVQQQFEIALDDEAIIQVPGSSSSSSSCGEGCNRLGDGIGTEMTTINGEIMIIQQHQQQTKFLPVYVHKQLERTSSTSSSSMTAHSNSTTSTTSEEDEDEEGEEVEEETYVHTDDADADADADVLLCHDEEGEEVEETYAHGDNGDDDLLLCHEDDTSSLFDDLFDDIPNTTAHDDILKTEFQTAKSIKLHIDSYQKENFRDIAFHLMKNKSMEHIELHRTIGKEYKEEEEDEEEGTVVATNKNRKSSSSHNDDLPPGHHNLHRTMKELNWLFRTIRNLPKLEELRLVNFATHRTMNTTDGDDIEEERKTICQLLRNHPTLTTVWMDDGSPLILDALVTIPNLKIVHFNLSQSYSLSKLIEGSKTLQELYIHPTTNTSFVSYDSDHSLDMVRAISSRQSKLRVLDLGDIYILPFTAKVLAYALRENNCLEILDFSLAAGDNGGGGTTNTSAMAVMKRLKQTNLVLAEFCFMLQHYNTTLKVIRNYSHMNVTVSDELTQLLLTALKVNPTIQTFIFCEETPEITYQKRKIVSKKKKKKETLRTAACGTGSITPTGALVGSCCSICV